MYQSISKVGFLFGYTAMHSFMGGGTAISAEATVIGSATTSIVRSVERSQALFGAKSEAISQLMKVNDECGSELHPESVFQAIKFIRALPDSISLPEFAADPDGSVSLDWIASRKQMFSLSIGRSNRLAYAWLDGTNSGHGVENFDGQSVPERVLGGILAIAANGNSFASPA